MLTLRHKLPMPVKNFGFWLLDLKYRNDPLIPPLRMRRFIDQTTNYTSDRTRIIRSYLITNPCNKILDVGCGCGSLSYSLIQYSDFCGEYYGLDIVQEFITWLNENVTAKHPNFHFTHADIYNGDYNQKGQASAATYRFPYPDASFDCVFLCSVFSHMLPDGIENYLGEVSRVLKPTGYCFVSWFFMPQKGWVNTSKGYEIMDPTVPEAAIAYPWPHVMDLYRRFNLEYLTDLKYGPQLGHIVCRRNTN